jgi:hypothetical protein
MLGYILGAWFTGMALGASAVAFGPADYGDPVLGIGIAWVLGMLLIGLQVFRNWQRRALDDAAWRGAQAVVQPVRTTSLSLTGE